VSLDLQQQRGEILRWKDDPIYMVRSQFGVEPDPIQKDGLLLFADPTHQRIAAKASKGPGKTAWLAWCIWNFLATRPHPRIAATSISWDNLSDNLWAELAKWQHKSAFFKRAFEWTKTRIWARDHPETWWASARTWSRTADATKQADTLAGLHEDYAMAVLDESGGIPDAVMATAEGVLATVGGEHRILQAGNPTNLEGPLYRAVTTEAHLWKLLEVSGDPDDPKRSPRIKIAWAREQIEKYGRDNPWVKVNVFAEFPPASMNVLLGPDQVQRALGKHLKEPQYVREAKILGVDPGRFGGSRSVIFPRQGLAAFLPVVSRPDRTQKDWTGALAGRIAQGFEKWKADAIIVDDTGGWGAGIIDALQAAGYPVFPVNASASAMDPRYKNRRAEMHFAAAEWVKKGGALPNMAELRREATAATYWFRGNQFQIEDKEQVKEKLNGDSPDLWDAFTLTFAVPIAPKTGIPWVDNRHAHAKTEPDEDQDVVEVGRAVM
jgi:hypothetical protein